MIPKPVNKLATTIFALRDALKEAQVLNYDEEPVINLPLEAGRRFEMWLAFAVDPQFLSHLHPQTLERDDGYYLGTGAKIPVVNGSPIPGPVRLNDGDLIEICGVRMNFVIRE